MADKLSRRSFASTLAAAAFAASRPARPDVGAHAKPVVRAPKLKLSCNLYSFNAPLRSGEMSLEQALDVCAELGFDAVDATGYHFPGYPEPPADAYLYGIKRRAFLSGLDVSGTGVRNDFTLPDAAERQKDVAHVNRWVDVAAKLGAPVLRVFDGRAEAKGPNREQRIGWVVEAFRECAAYAGSRGVMLAYQNHDELMKTATEVLALRERVGSEWLGLNVDVGSLRTGDPYEEIARLAPFACTWQLKERLYRAGVEEKTNVRRVIAIICDAGYRGYVPIESLGAGDPREKVRAFLDEVRQAIA